MPFLRPMCLVLVFASLGCSITSNAPPSSQGDQGNGSDDGGSSSSSASGGKAAPASTVTCADVCKVIDTCGITDAQCEQICPTLPLGCQGCLAEQTDCSSTACNAICGNLGSGGNKAPAAAPGSSCDPLTFDFTSQTNTAGGIDETACSAPSDCESQACITGQIGSKSVGFCADQNNCNDPNAQACDDGWKCAEIPEYQAVGSLTRWSCVPANATPCAGGQLQYGN